MRELNAGRLLDVCNQLTALAQRIIDVRDGPTAPMLFPIDQTMDLVRKIDVLKTDLADASMPVSMFAVESLLDSLKVMMLDLEDGCVRFPMEALPKLSRSLVDISARIRDEMKTKTVLIMPHEKVRYLAQTEPPFGEAVANRFPRAAYDISEACSCFALSRYTASAFHLMRVVEIGVYGLADALTVTLNLNAGWLPHIQKLEAEIENLPSGSSAEKDRRKEFQHARAHLHAIRIAWRNDTMHPKSTYTEDEGVTC